MNEYIVGIDIGSSKICAAVGKLDKQGELRIIGITSSVCTGLKKEAVVDIDSTSQSIKSCIEELEKMIDVKISDAYLSIPSGICELIWNKGIVEMSSGNKKIKSCDVERVLNAVKNISIPSDKEIIGVIPEKYIIDGYETNREPVGFSGLKLEVNAKVILSQSMVINNLFKSFNTVGIKIKGIVFQPLAISNVVFKNEEFETGALLIDIGSECTDVNLFKNGNLYLSFMIPLGGNILTKDISVCLNIPFSQAEKIKIKHGNLEKHEKEAEEKIKTEPLSSDETTIDKNMLSEIIEARVEEILLIIYNKLREAGVDDKISSVIIVGGGISLFRGVCEISKSIFKKPVRIGAPEYVGAASPLYSTAVGVVKDAADILKNDKINDDLGNKAKKAADNDDNCTGIFSKIKRFFADFF